MNLFLNKSAYSLGLILFLLYSTGCKKEVIPVYEVNSVTVRKPGASKDRVKTTTEFISIAYSDIFGSVIPQQTLTELTACYQSFGDKVLIEDLIIKNFLNNPSTDIPDAPAMNADVEGFVKEAYRKFFNREPGEYELWWMKEYIGQNASLTPEQIYYSFLTAAEYRYY